MTQEDNPRTAQPATPAAALVVQNSHWRRHEADPPLSMGYLRPIAVVDFYRPRQHPHSTDNAPLPRAQGSNTNQG
jgi:hypothetical protein